MNKKESPSIDQWLKEAKEDKDAAQCGMYLCHTGVVRKTAKATVRAGKKNLPLVTELAFSYDEEKVARAIEKARHMEGIYYVRVWLNEGRLSIGDDIMKVLIGGDIRPRVIDALQTLVGEIKNYCVEEKEVY